jgi:hypothetical protein
MKMDVKDKGVLAALGFDDHGEGSWRVLRRGGHILLLVPDCASLVSKGLQLYRPQRLPARLFVGAVSRFPFDMDPLIRFNNNRPNGNLETAPTNKRAGSLCGRYSCNPLLTNEAQSGTNKRICPPLLRTLHEPSP